MRVGSQIVLNLIPRYQLKLKLISQQANGYGTGEPAMQPAASLGAKLKVFDLSDKNVTPLIY